MAYIGRGINNLSNAQILDVLTFTNSAGPYNLLQGGVAFTPISAQALVIAVDGVVQSPSSYTISGTQITFLVSMASTLTNDFIVHNGVGLITQPADGTVGTNAIANDAVTTAKIANDAVATAKIADDAVTTAKILNDNVTYAKIQDTTTANRVIGAATAGEVGEVQVSNDMLSNNSISINGTSVALGGSISNVGVEDFPTVTGVSPAVITNAQTAVTVTGTNFVSIPIVEAINTSGAITTADSVVYVSATSLTVTFTLPVDGTYYIRVENVTDGLAGRSSSAFLNVSDEPAWVSPAAGSIGTFSGTAAIGTQTFTATDATSFTCAPNPPVAGLTFTTGVGSCTITGTQTAHTSAASNSFTITATDAQGQTSGRTFSVLWSFDIEGSGGFN